MANPQPSTPPRRSARAVEKLLRTLSHELRNPVAAIRGSAENLLDGLCGPVAPEQRGALEVIRRSAELLGNQIERLLDRTRLERSTASADPAPLPRSPGSRSLGPATVERRRR